MPTKSEIFKAIRPYLNSEIRSARNLVGVVFSRMSPLGEQPRRRVGDGEWYSGAETRKLLEILAEPRRNGLVLLKATEKQRI